MLRALIIYRKQNKLYIRAQLILLRTFIKNDLIAVVCIRGAFTLLHITHSLYSYFMAHDTFEVDICINGEGVLPCLTNKRVDLVLLNRLMSSHISPTLPHC